MIPLPWTVFGFDFSCQKLFSANWTVMTISFFEIIRFKVANLVHTSGSHDPTGTIILKRRSFLHFLVFLCWAVFADFPLLASSLFFVRFFVVARFLFWFDLLTFGAEDAVMASAASSAADLGPLSIAFLARRPVTELVEEPESKRRSLISGRTGMCFNHFFTRSHWESIFFLEGG